MEASLAHRGSGPSTRPIVYQQSAMENGPSVTRSPLSPSTEPEPVSPQMIQVLGAQTPLPLKSLFASSKGITPHPLQESHRVAIELRLWADLIEPLESLTTAMWT